MNSDLTSKHFSNTSINLGDLITYIISQNYIVTDGKYHYYTCDVSNGYFTICIRQTGNWYSGVALPNVVGTGAYTFTSDNGAYPVLVTLDANSVQQMVNSKADKTALNSLEVYYHNIFEKTVYSMVVSKTLSIESKTVLWTYTSINGNDIVNIDAKTNLSAIGATNDCGAIGYGISAKIAGNVVDSLIYADHYTPSTKATIRNVSLGTTILLPNPGDYIILEIVMGNCGGTHNYTMIYSNREGKFSI